MKNYSAAALCLLLMSCSTLKTTKPKDPDRELVKAAQSGPVEGNEPADISREPASTKEKPLTLKANQVIDPAFLRSQADYHFALADSYSLNGDVDRAIEEYKLTLIYDSESPTLRYKLANEFIKKGMLSRAVEQAETAIKLKTDYWDAYLLLGTLYTSFKLYDKALDQYRMVLKSDPDNIEAGLYIGALLAEQKKYTESIAHFKKLATTSGTKQAHLAWYYMARVYNEQGKKKEAEQTFVKAVDVKPDFLEGVLGLGAFYEGEKQEQKALKIYKTYQEKYGPSAKVAGALGRIYLEDEDYDLAYKQFEILEGLDSDNLNNKVKMALILIEQKKFDRAIRKLKEILAVAPDSEKIRFYLAAVYEETKVYKEAIEQFQFIQADSSLYQEAVIHTAYLFKLLGEIENSSKTMEVAVTKRPDVPQFYSFYSSILDDQKEVGKAISVLEKGVAKFPQDEQMYFYLGSMQDKAGNKEKTITNMRKVISLNSEHVQALNYLGFTMADLNRDLDEAEKFVRRALKLKPDDAYITDSLGWVLFKQGRVKESVATLERAYQMKPTESIIAEHLGDAYFKYALKNKARQMYQRAVSLETNEENLAKLKQKLSNLDVDDNRKPASVESR